MKCCFCRKKIIGYGNNPEPLGTAPKRCCDDCNIVKVIPARLKN